ncbi:MAG: helix-turn-helix transcriptional regulator [Anaerolineales bacterium]|nr:helix-turn-helix transcriptional regulator [Anaerolineales bacterium]
MRNNLVGKQVQIARKRFNPSMTQSDLAARLEVEGWPSVSRSVVAKIEVGIRQVTDIELVRLSKVLNVSVDWLLDSNQSG